jgi:hypothetical protein
MDDIQKLIEEHGLTPVPKTNPQIDSLVNQFGLVPAQTEGGYGVGTFAKDVTKNVAAGAIPGVLGAPEAIQAAANQQVRTSQAVPTDIVNMLANPQALTNKFVESLGFKPIFREEDKTLIPEEMTKKQNMAMDEVLSKGKIPQLKSLSELGNKLGQNISQTVSPEMQLAIANFVPTGSLDDIAHGRLEKISLGAKPSMLGLAGQFSNVFGSVMPGMIGTLVTKDPRYMEAFGFGQAGSEAIGNARQYIQSLDDNQLSNNSPYFQELLRAGYDSKTARMMTEEKAADTAAAAEGVVGMLGGNFTANLITGKFDKALISSVRNRALNIAAKTAKGAVTGATEEGLQEMSEGIASDLGINKTVAKEIGADAFSNLILGAIGGGGPGAVSGARAKSEEQKVQEEEKKTILQEGKNVTVEGAPPIPPAPKKPATITEEELATEEEIKPPKEEALIPSSKPGFDQWRTEKGIIFGSKEEYEAALPGLKKQYEAEKSNASVTEEPINEKEAKVLKGIEVQKRISAANEAKLLTEAELDKVFNLYDNDKLDAANKQLDKILASKQAPTEVTPTAEETLAKLKADQAAAKEAKAKREPITLETVSAELPEGKLSSEYKLDSDGVFTRTDDVAGEKQDLSFVTKDGSPEWVPNSEVEKDKLEPVKVDEDRAKSMIGAEKSFIETEAAKHKKPAEEKPTPLGKKISKGLIKYLNNIANAKTPEERLNAINELRSVGYTEESAKEQYPGLYEKAFNKPPVEKTRAEINKNRQAEKKVKSAESTEEKLVDAIQSMAYKNGNPTKNTANDFIAKYGRKMFDDAVAADLLDNEPGEGRIFPSNNYAYKVSHKYYDAKGKKIKAAKEPAEKKAEKPAPKVEPKAPKEVHTEGNKSEPVTAKTIEESIDKASSKVDYNKIKTVVKNQFDQAIKRAKIQTEKEWSEDKGLLPAEKFVTIDVPGDGKFKVKNNVERLKELQTKMVNATVPKVGKEQSGPSSGSVEAFKGMVDDKDMENAIEYAKLKGLDLKTVKLNLAQRNTVHKYLKNPAEFERQKEESEQMAEARQTALRADQKKRIAERLEADKKREEEARFKAVLDTTIRSTQPQLKDDIAKRKITSMDAARMLEVIPGLPTGTVKPYVTKELTQIADDSRTIDVEVREITPSQMKLLTNQVGKLSDADIATLEEHYGVANYSSDFMKRIGEDIITYTNKGAEAIDKAIRSIIAKLQAGMLAVAMVFNPAYMSQQSAVVYPTKTVTEEVRATVPDSAKEMSDSGKKAFSVLFPAINPQSENKLFTIVDKPTSKVFVFKPDGSLLLKDNVVLGMAMGDTYVGQTDFKGNRITPAGLMKVKAEKGGATYDGKTIYTVGNVSEGWNTAFMHTVYLKEADAIARKKALATGEATRLSHGCVNASPEVMAKIGEDNRMDGSHVFVVPDNQAKTDDYIANNVFNEDLTRETVKPATKTTQVPEKPTTPKIVAREEKVIERKTQAQINQERQKQRRESILKAESPYYGTFTNNIDEVEFDKMRYETNQEKRKQLASDTSRKVNHSITKILRELVNGKFDIRTQRDATEALASRTEARKEKKQKKVEIKSARWFVTQAQKNAEMHKTYPNDPRYGLEEDVVAVIEDIYNKYPKLLEGLRLSIAAAPQRGAAANFNPFSRIVTLFKDTSGTSDPKSVRHEVMHSVEQMMPDDVYQMVVDNWANSLEKAIAKHKDEAHQKFFNRVIDFVINPTQVNQDKALAAMPSYSMYQYINPSEYWAVNAEKLFAQKLGGRWENFKRAIQKLFESLKSLFGFENTYGVHKALDKLFKGPMERGENERMLVDYVKRNNPEATLTFLNNVEDIDDFMDTYDRPDAPLHYSPSVMDRFLGGKKAIKELSRKMKENPMLPVNNMVSNVGRGVLYTRVKNVWFGAGLDEADRRKYEGQLRDSEGHIVASIAVTNALHAGHVGTQVMIQGKLEFDPITQMFHAVKDKLSLANVVRIKNKLEKRIGAQRAANLIQAYFEAKRSRSIVNEYLGRTAELTKLLEEQMDPSTSDERQLKLNKLIADAEEDVKNIQRALDKVNMDDDQIDEAIAFEDEYPELREMMDNWTSVNQNMIDNMEFSGIISKKRAETLRNIKDYVPWYRIQDDATDVHSAQGVRTLTNVGREKTFKEGTTELEIDDIVDNMIHNVMMLTRNSMRNYAANRVAMEYAERNDKGKLQVYPTEDREKGIFNILAGGRRINIKIADPLIAESVLGLENIEIPMGNILRFFANGLRWSVTINPIFQAKQLFMDAPTAALVTGVKHPFRLWAGAFGGFIRGLKPHDPIVDLLKSYGIGGYRSAARSPEHELKQEIGVLNKNYFDKAVSILDHISDASDYAQRVAVYKRVLAETGDQMQAIVQANNVIDFQKKGSGKAAQVLTRTVSFMNAYAQQIDVLAQALSGKGLKGLKRQQAFARLVYTGGLLASVSLLYCMTVGDDDEYQKMDDQTKMRNFIIPKSLTKTIGMDHAVMLPMSTSAAFFFKAVPEMLYNKIVNEGTKNQVDNTRLRNALAKAAADSLLGPTPFPTGLKPFAEIGLNYNFFTGGTITPKGMEKLDPSRQYTNTTSELGKIFSKLSGGVLNPIQADHLMRSLGGTVAATAMWGSNLFSGNRPDAEAKANPLYGSFIAADVPRGREDLFYDLQERADRANETFKDLNKKQHATEAKQWFDENKQLIIASGFTTGAATSLKSINAEIRRLSDLPAEKMSAEEKRQKINFYKNKKNDILEQTIAFRLKAGL